ncbi:MAG: DUF2934 domain-containing protein [Myxococcota bacterium]
MPYDITMCSGTGCPQRARCYRYRAYPAGRQDWFVSAPYHASTDTCDAFWSIVPADAADLQAAAYLIWQREGEPEGRALDHWLEAEWDAQARMQRRLRPLSEIP